MNSVRIRREKKNRITKIAPNEESPEEAAKQRLIQISNLWDCDTDFKEDNPEYILDQKVHSKAKNSTAPHFKRTNNKFTKITQSFDDSTSLQKTEIKSQRLYRYGDKFFKVSARNPISTSNFIMIGVSPSQEKRCPSSNVHQSQYIVRQKRNQSKIKRSLPFQNKQDFTPKLCFPFFKSSGNKNYLTQPSTPNVSKSSGQIDIRKSRNYQIIASSHKKGQAEVQPNQIFL